MEISFEERRKRGREKTRMGRCFYNMREWGPKTSFESRVPGLDGDQFRYIDGLEQELDGRTYPVILSKISIKDYLRITGRDRWDDAYIDNIRPEMADALGRPPAKITSDGERVYVSDGREFYMILGLVRGITTEN